MKLIDNQDSLTQNVLYLRYTSNSDFKRVVIFNYCSLFSKILVSKTISHHSNPYYGNDSYTVNDDYEGAYYGDIIFSVLFELDDDEIYNYTTLELFTENI